MSKAENKFAAELAREIWVLCNYGGSVDAEAQIAALLEPHLAVCVKCGHNKGVTSHGICKYHVCLCECEFGAEKENPDAKLIHVLGRPCQFKSGAEVQDVENATCYACKVLALIEDNSEVGLSVALVGATAERDQLQEMLRAAIKLPQPPPHPHKFSGPFTLVGENWVGHLYTRVFDFKAKQVWTCEGCGLITCKNPNK